MGSEENKLMAPSRVRRVPYIFLHCWGAVFPTIIILRRSLALPLGIFDFRRASVGKVPGLARLSFPARLPRNSRLWICLFERTTPAKPAEQRLSANQRRFDSQDEVDRVHMSRGSAAVAHVAQAGRSLPGHGLLSLTPER